MNLSQVYFFYGVYGVKRHFSGIWRWNISFLLAKNQEKTIILFM
jgi:hypothetical protein